MILDIRSKKNVEDIILDNIKNISPPCERKEEYKANKGKGIQSHECGKVLVTLKCNIPRFKRSRKRECQSHGLILKMRVKKKQLTR